MRTQTSVQNLMTAPPSVAGQTGVLQRKCSCGNHTVATGECTECRKKPTGELQRKATGSVETPAVPTTVNETLSSPGYSLLPETRAFFEPRFGRDFSSVRVHYDSRAAESAQAVNAEAYTVGQHIVFGSGRYAPSTTAGQRLLAHELTHTIQQRGNHGIQHQLRVGSANDAAEVEASNVADHVIAGGASGVPTIQQAPSAIIARQPLPESEQSEPDFSTPQRRGGRPRAAFVDAGQRGPDQVRVAVTRYLCDCRGRSVTRTRASARLQPRPGFTLEICRGRVTGRIVGEVTPSSLTTGRARIGVEGNIAPGAGGTGARVGIGAEARNTGSEPQVGGSADLRLRLPGGQQIGAGGSILRGTQTGTIDTEITGGVEIGGVRGTITATNPQDNRRGVIVGVGGNLPGQDVQQDTCRECRCPVAYSCVEDIPPRDYQEPVPYEVEDRSRLRYYFRLDSDQDTGNSVLQTESHQMPDRVRQRISQGARIRSIVGYASPEDNRDRPTPNEQLSLSRARRLRDYLSNQLGSGVPLPEPTAGGELFGRVATIQPGSSLADAILTVGFGSPEDVTNFLIGEDIPNAQLADQFLRLLGRVTEPADRLRLFGVEETSPAAPRLLAAIDQFVARRGRGRRPWEGIFDYLRFATVELSQTRRETRMEDRRTSGSLTRMNDAQCPPYARSAEDAGSFGPAEREPQTEADCPPGEPRNRPEFDRQCIYD